MVHRSQTVNCFNQLEMGRMDAKWTILLEELRVLQMMCFNDVFGNSYFPKKLEEVVSEYQIVKGDMY